MDKNKYVLVVDDSIINRKLVAKLLHQDYQILEASNGAAALEVLAEFYGKIKAVILDLVMPVMDGYQFLKKISEDDNCKNIPVIVMTGDNDTDNEIKVLQLGAWDFVTKPYNGTILKFRLANAIARSQISAYERIRYLAEYDDLTGIFNENKFFAVTQTMLSDNRDTPFAFVCFDIDRFQLINSYFGAAEGDNLLRYVAKKITEIVIKCKVGTYGRIKGDNFAFCVPYEKENFDKMLEYANNFLTEYNPSYNTVPSIGIYLIEDYDTPVNIMLDRAELALKQCKGSYVQYYCYYNHKLSEDVRLEQEIVNDMKNALAEKQFDIYLQPKYNLFTAKPSGAEALVRWFHPTKGMISPALFIPIFERNGFISKLDFFVWEKACQIISQLTADNAQTFPISVNVSRVNLYNKNFVEDLMALVNRYKISPSMLNLELTESAYTDNPSQMIETIAKLQQYGFVIMMDDFGSGYSSLNVLKDMNVDVIKIDMKFFSATKIAGRGENIIESVVRMTKWLGVSVIAEGVETEAQVNFLRSIGCEYVQGYYFSKPIPVKDYIKLLKDLDAVEENRIASDREKNTIWASYGDVNSLFNDEHQAYAMYEFDGSRIELIRVNCEYYRLMGSDDIAIKCPNPTLLIVEEHRQRVQNMFVRTVETKQPQQCDYIRSCRNGELTLLNITTKYITKVGTKHLVFGIIKTATMQKDG